MRRLVLPVHSHPTLYTGMLLLASCSVSRLHFAFLLQTHTIISMASDAIISDSKTSPLSCSCTMYAFFYDPRKLPFLTLNQIVTQTLKQFLFTTSEITKIADFRQLKILIFEARQKNWPKEESSFLVHTLKQIMVMSSYRAWMMLGLQLIFTSIHQSLESMQQPQNVTPLYDATTQTYPSLNYLLMRLKPRSCKSALLRDSHRRVRFAHQQLIRQLEVLRWKRRKCNSSTS